MRFGIRPIEHLVVHERFFLHSLAGKRHHHAQIGKRDGDIHEHHLALNGLFNRVAGEHVGVLPHELKGIRRACCSEMLHGIACSGTYSAPVPIVRRLLNLPGLSKSPAPILLPHEGHSNTLWVDSPSNAAPQKGHGMLTCVACSSSSAVPRSSWKSHSISDELRQ